MPSKLGAVFLHINVIYKITVQKFLTQMTINISLDTGTDARSETSNMFKPHMMGSIKSDLGQSLFYESNQMIMFSLKVDFNYTCTPFDVRQLSSKSNKSQKYTGQL